MLFRNLVVAALAGVGAAEIFSFSQWVEDIIENPDGDNLTPDEAVVAWELSINNTKGGLDKRSERGLDKRYACNHILDAECSITNAVWCVNDLAQKGARGQMCEACAVARMCNRGDAQIIGAAGGDDPNGKSVTCTRSNCNDVARAGGIILDMCSRGDGTVMGYEKAWGNGNLAVTLRGH